MRNEASLISELMNIVNGGKLSNDVTYDERLIRSFLRKHRARKVFELFQKGRVPDLLFQDLGELEFDQVSGTLLEYAREMPALINLPENEGLRVYKGNFDIPVLGAESFRLSQSNILNASKPKAKFDGTQLTVYIGSQNLCDFFGTSSKELAVSSFNLEASETDNVPKIKVSVKGILYNCDDAPGYDFTKDVYPCPSEIIDQIQTSTLARDLDLLIRTPSDNVTNAREDSFAGQVSGNQGRS